MGLVLFAHDPHLDRPVALKVMLPDIAANASAKERFLREARAAAKLRSDHIVTIYQVDEDRGIPYLAMEYLEGASLDQFVRDGRKLSLVQILRIGREVARGLADAHARQLIHRDIKPGNIWLDKSHAGRAKILDFGLVSMQDDAHVTQFGTIVGTPAYMAPEQARGEKVDARADLFSLGCLLYRLCTHDVPFKGQGTMAVLMAVATQKPTPPSQCNPAIPQPLSDLIMQLLAKDASRRPASARVVIDTLTAIERSLRGPQTSEIALPVAVATPVPATEADPTAALFSFTDQIIADVKAEPEPIPIPMPSKRTMVLTLLAVAFAGFLVLAGGLLYWLTNNGTVSLEINDPDIKVVFDKDGPTITGADKKDIKLRAGEHSLYIQRGDLAFDTDKFILKRGQTITLKIEWLEEARLVAMLQGKEIGRMKGDVPRINRKVDDKESPKLTGDAALKGSLIDLLPLIDPAKDKVNGKWELNKAGELTSDAEKVGRIRIPYRPPAEYDLRVAFTPAGRTFIPILVAGGRQFTAVISSTRCGFEFVDGLPVADAGNRTAVPNDAASWAIGKRQEALIEIRKDREFR
jgi:hypothetical protein